MNRTFYLVVAGMALLGPIPAISQVSIPCCIGPNPNCTGAGDGAGGFCSGTVTWCQPDFGCTELEGGVRPPWMEETNRICYSTAGPFVTGPCNETPTQSLKTPCVETSGGASICCYTRGNVTGQVVGTRMIPGPGGQTCGPGGGGEA